MNPSSSLPSRPAHLRLLGQFRLEFDREPVEVCGNAQRLLAFVGLRRRAGRSVVAGSLWPGATEAQARGSLRTALWKLARYDSALIQCTPGTIALADDVSVDAHALSDSARDVLYGRGPLDDDQALLGLLNRGDLLPDWDDDWVVLEREWLRQLRLNALDTLSERLAGQGLPALALEAALASVRIEPLRESAHRAVVSAHLAEGNLNEALRHYDAFRQLLRAELGVEPSVRFARMIPQPQQ
ncbi:SARP family transcriptional regulator [Streptomyces sp. QHH-9511]|uniref:AfsR/SARP family transcriptional regulator n=1 Tax=Streptomyces sp. QHH-9511 TaxID=2684468 RepID=UPI001316F66A|nr:BTAD domain-containing putative transcriptional regulator [Streptomyces sp. QHH-9511]QGZ51993.1 SARP family transcriptional regulator [Streptomyces sp. QHH-9511]